ncbi:MAG: NUDIX domain-containing protein [Chloroflexota bacterium]|nr:NUDIX domain-containing protein [Chloroflexota bacterium]
MNPQPTFAQDPDELFDVITEDGAPTGIVKRRAEVHRDGDWHRAIHVWVYGVQDGIPFLLFNLRGRHKDTWPGVLDVTVGGHLAAGETIEQAFREIEEEIGIAADPGQLRFLETRKAYGKIERELQDVFLYRDDRPLGEYRSNPAELEGLVRLPVTDAVAIFSAQATSVEATILDAADLTVGPITVTSAILLPPRYFPYYLNIARAIERTLAGDTGIAS